MSVHNYWVSYTNEGVLISREQPDAPEPFRSRHSSPEIPGFVEQLKDEAYAVDTPAGALIPWEAHYALVDDRNYASSLHLLHLPPVSEITLRLASQGALTDRDFRITFAGVNAAGQTVALTAMRGGIVQTGTNLRLLTQPVWRLVRMVSAFNRRTDAERNDTFHRQQWGRTRRAALEAKAELGDFLRRTVVLTPEKLKLHLRKTAVSDTTVTEVQPTFDGAPESWLSTFDKADRVKERYDIVTPGGIVQILTTPQIRTVLDEIKRMPGRRIAGARAETFLLNPYSALGPDATQVLDEEQLNEAKATAGISFERFRPRIATNAAGFPFEVGIEIDEANGSCTRRVFREHAELKDFIDGLGRRLEGGRPIFGWQGYEFELQGDAREHLAQLQAALEVRAKPPIIIERDRVYDLSQYDARVAGIGHDKPYISSYIVKRKDDDGWFPENLMVLLQVPGRDDVVPVSPEQFKEWEKELEAAKDDGLTTLPGTTDTVPVSVAREIADRIRGPLNSPEPPPSPVVPETATNIAPKPPRLIIRGNIDALEHPEPVEPDLAAPPEMERPGALKPDVVLRSHQVEGVARMQQLFASSPGKCRGVLMADDMGLGKTIQLLTLIAWSVEKFADLPPALIVAPVSLLENWRLEIERFFIAGSLPILTAYGDNLLALRVPRVSIDAQLQGEGLVRFLRPGWRGNACVVLTTYETLRDLEFSFAIEEWSIMVCDEAQRVKNPNAMITRAAKKQKVRFRIACTGTPVENSLADLWCLYDFVQPGFLSALNDFGREYGRPIEQWEEGGREKLGELRAKIEPLLIRRTKKDVAKDLPPKIEAGDCHVPLSSEQRSFYIGAFHLGGQAQSADGERQNHLGILQRLRLICADPRPYGLEAFIPEELGDYRRKAPKMNWLLARLEAIRAAKEKALIFAEHRDIQRLLQYYIGVHFGFRPDIINGDTATAAKSQTSRQKRIDAFQARPGFGAIILSPLAVGFGVNIQSANHVIHFLRHWNPAKEDQATDRAYRIGQEKPVHVYCPLTVADDFKTFDVKLDELLRRKRALATDMLMGCGQLSGADFDIRDLAPPGATEFRDAPITAERLAAMDCNFFEAFVATLWRKQGYEFVAVTPKSGDGGIDVIAIRGSQGSLIQCKSSGVEGRQLGWDAIKEVVAGTAKYNAQYPGVSFNRICATNQAFNPNAWEQARLNGVELVERERLVYLLEVNPVTVLDVHNFCAL